MGERECVGERVWWVSWEGGAGLRVSVEGGTGRWVSGEGECVRERLCVSWEGGAGWTLSE